MHCCPQGGSAVLQQHAAVNFFLFDFPNRTNLKTRLHLSEYINTLCTTKSYKAIFAHVVEHVLKILVYNFTAHSIKFKLILAGELLGCQSVVLVHGWPTRIHQGATSAKQLQIIISNLNYKYCKLFHMIKKYKIKKLSNRLYGN